ncbi:MAG: hypothetical protein E7Z79_00565 [Methanobrevibacter thaueri]|uniref:Uncharacterized protein n=1 Tax=Methanobrevibacter thaueri TaxID=190975 RepID=A0A8T3VCB7_9EURY|nr:hypothetical protein [Methanobrevibacter thaueri]MBE6500914.1 hypothetical protein [Methanobrevibacter thaueri]
MKRRTKIILIFLILLALGGAIAFEEYQKQHTPYRVLAKNDLGSVERIIYGCQTSEETIALITGIHPREKLSIDPEIKAAREYANEHSKVNFIHYQVNVTKDADDYDKGRANGEKLVHDYVNPDVTRSNANCVIISHSHIEDYGEGYYLATPEMDDASVEIAKKIHATSDFGYYPRTGNESYNSTSAQLVSCPIAKAGYPTFVYEIPENITAQNSTDWTKDLFSLMVKYTS